VAKACDACGDKNPYWVTLNPKLIAAELAEITSEESALLKTNAEEASATRFAESDATVDDRPRTVVEREVVAADTAFTRLMSVVTNDCWAVTAEAELFATTVAVESAVESEETVEMSEVTRVCWLDTAKEEMFRVVAAVERAVVSAVTVSLSPVTNVCWLSTLTVAVERSALSLATMPESKATVERFAVTCACTALIAPLITARDVLCETKTALS
jgi:hypothetical protein